MTPAAKAPTVFTVAPGVPFVDALAAGILDRTGADPLALSAVTVLLPTRRACRALREAFLRRSGGAALLLPRMRPLGDVDEDDLILDAADDGPLGEDGGGFDLPPAIPGLRRQLLLTRLVLADKARAASPDQAVRLAEELARLIDQVHTERLDFADLDKLAPAEYAEHWQLTLEFLDIVTAKWPKILRAEGAVDPAHRRNLLLGRLAETWRKKPPTAPVIAAGSTGTIPATADLLAVVAALPAGQVVLPGLDRDAPDNVWAALGANHPQFGMARLLDRLEIDRADVKDWPAPEPISARRGRAHLLNVALRPAGTGGREEKLHPQALQDVARVDCPGPREEALVVALAIRQALQEPEATVALVTPDRDLARRVAAELGRWDIAVDDSAGMPLANTPPGAFLDLALRMVEDNFAPVALLACLKHPLASGGMATPTFRALVRKLETTALRGPRPAPGIDGLSRVLPEDASDLRALVARIAAMANPLSNAMHGPAMPLKSLFGLHVAFAEALAAADNGAGAQRLWATDAGEAAAAFVGELDQAAEALGAIAPVAYPGLFEALLERPQVRPRYGRHPRVHVWGLLEARLQHADVAILAGLNEGTWPPETRVSPWMSRPMMAAFGLPPPERRIGLTAHDFAQACNAPRVLLTRSVRVEGTPTVASRWLLRLENLIDGTDLQGALHEGLPLLDWALAIDEPAKVEPCTPPRPTPPVGARPRELSVTEVETLMRDPYGIYAKKILGLKALDPVDADPGAADYGSLVHRALDAFVAAHPPPLPLPTDAMDRLLAFGRESFDELLDRPGVWAFWWPRFERVAAWFVGTEDARRHDLKSSACEVSGRIEIAAPGGPFSLKAKADRIDRLNDGTLAVIDYKTGQPPSKTEVKAGFAPQLPLEGWMAEEGRFAGVPKAAISALEFWRLSGGVPAGEVKGAGDDPRTLIDEAKMGLAALIARFDDPSTAYEARPHPEHAPKYSDYEHLARVKEWGAGGGGEGE